LILLVDEIVNPCFCVLRVPMPKQLACTLI
jgi:hypothetical protein